MNDDERVNDDPWSRGPVPGGGWPAEESSEHRVVLESVWPSGKALSRLVGS